MNFKWIVFLLITSFMIVGCGLFDSASKNQLEFRFLPSTASQETRAHAVVIVGELEEGSENLKGNEATWYIPIDYWDRKKYVESWLAGIKALKQGDVGAFNLLADKTDADSYVEGYGIWRVGDKFVAQSIYLIHEEFKGGINPEYLWKYIGDKPDPDNDQIVITKDKIDKLESDLTDYLSKK